MKTQTYTITVKDGLELAKYAGKTYAGFQRVSDGTFAGCYQGYAEGDSVIFFADEIEFVGSKETAGLEGPFKNPATSVVMNEFTRYVRDNPGCFVRLRNGLIAQPKYLEKAGADGSVFEMDTKTSYYAWSANGKYFSEQSQYDMMEIAF